jgi:hypothetical protein
MLSPAETLTAWPFLNERPRKDVLATLHLQGKGHSPLIILGLQVAALSTTTAISALLAIPYVQPFFYGLHRNSCRHAYQPGRPHRRPHRRYARAFLAVR